MEAVTTCVTTGARSSMTFQFPLITLASSLSLLSQPQSQLAMENSFETQSLQSELSRRFDISSKTWIDFKSETDALFASFWLGEQLGDKPLVSFDAINALLMLLRHPRFHLEYLSYNDGTDILSNIAASRRAAAFARSMSRSEKTSDQTDNHVPEIVVNLVVQELGQNMPFHAPQSYKRGGYSCVEETPDQKALKNMCLVHRLWTIPA